MKRSPDKCHGVLALSKPTGMTSHDAVDRVRKIIGQRTVGHTGTLDPAAEGLMLVLLGKATKIARYLSDRDKVYEVEIKLGLESTTYDAEGVDPNAEPSTVPEMSDAQLDTILDNFRGSITQKVPAYSAVHVDGERLYELARRGEEVAELPERTVIIHELKLIERDLNHLSLRVSCSKGTYIRSLAHDIGREIGCGAYLSKLKRTRIGSVDLQQALSLEALESAHTDRLLDAQLLSLDEILGFSALLIDEQFQTRLANGVRPGQSDIAGLEGDFEPGDTVLVKNSQGSVLAIGSALVASSTIQDRSQGDILSYDRVLR